MSDSQTSISVVVADDHPLVRQGVAGLLRSSPDIQVLAECNDGTSALKAISDFAPDVAVLDLSMPGLTGLEVLTILKDSVVRTRVVLLTATATDKQLVTALARGARGLLHKDVALDELIECIRDVSVGKKWISKTVSDLIANCTAQPRTIPALTHLSPREREITVLTSKGLSNKAIARRLTLSEGTIKIHLHNIYQKLGVANRTALSAMLTNQDAAA